MSNKSTLPSHEEAMPITDSQRLSQVRRAGFVALWTNLVLVVGQILIGVLAHAWSLVADAVHTLSDLATDAMVLWASQKGARPPDADHPYGHARIETLASLVLGLILIAVGTGFLWVSGWGLTQLDHAPAIGQAALYMALITLLIKESLFRYLHHVGKRTGSRLLVANAWHARSDAASSLVVAIGIGGSLLGYGFLEPLAAALVGFMIVRMGAQFAWESASELMDAGLSPKKANELRAILRETPGVRDVHSLRTRKMAQHVLCDVHIQVAPRLSVSEGHRIGEAARARVFALQPEVTEVLIHVDCEEDDDDEGAHLPMDKPCPLPERTDIEWRLASTLGFSPREVVLHYLGGAIEVDVILEKTGLSGDTSLDELEARLLQTLREISRVRICRILIHGSAPPSDPLFNSDLPE
jgi:cation diffusion facilitator family transporter